ncbi:MULTISPECIES: PP2C family protein-serine/threonine phosphatase [Streptacidiphilus]|uniref:PP2C family protein-serine/threonine phosphatase n=1 Tax=Streptacidiphilus cavernicola TaxID=3342716 RepID=A0ABV6UKN7_9ACTN|nr:PP2C family protein-serine/threonine phosphatase [Streptacidiphilus jeojiense]
MDAPEWFVGWRSWRSRAGLVAIALAVMAVIALADVLSPPDVHLGPLLVVAPAFTASFGGPRLTGFIGLLAVLTLVCIGLARGVLGTENLIVQIGSMVALSALLTVFCRLREHHLGELSRARYVSEATQRVLLPPIPETAGPLRIASWYHAAEAGTRIGGDLFALARTATGTRLIIGDVRGKGLTTLDATAMLLGAFRAAAHREAPLPELVSYLEGSVCWGLGQFTEAEGDVGERFITAVVVDIPDDEQVVHLINCGHPPPLLLGREHPTQLVDDQSSPPLGLGALANTPYEIATFRFGPGELLLLYTDGLIESRDRTGAFYPLPERAERWSAAAPRLFLDALRRDLEAHLDGPPEDDIALIALRRAGSTPGNNPGPGSNS